MQIRLTVALAPRGVRGAGGTGGTGTAGRAVPPPGSPGGYANVLVTAPSGTVLAAITGALATSAASALAASATGAVAGAGQGAEEGPQEPVVVFAGTRRLDPHRQIIGEPPLLDGAVISLHAPVTPAALPAHGAAVSAYGSAKARLHVVAGPDAGGIHLLQGGKVHLGRSAEADVPLDDPDVSRLHCAVTVSDGGAVTVTDLGSTNGTTVDGAPVGAPAVLFRPGSTLRIGETAIRLEAAGDPEAAEADTAPPLALPIAPDGEGRLRVLREVRGDRKAGEAGEDGRDRGGSGTASGGAASGQARVPGAPALPAVPSGEAAGQDGTGGHAYAPGGPFPGDSGTHGSGFAQPPPSGAEDRRRARGLGAWARRFAGGRAEPGPAAHRSDGYGPYGQDGAYGPEAHPNGPSGQGSYGPGSAEGYAAHPLPEGQEEAWGAPGLAPVTGDMDARWPDPAAVLLTALGPGPRLWEREPEHPDALTVRVGTAHRGGGHGDPVTVALRQAGSLGLAGPRSRLAGLTRSVIAQLTALHGPSGLEVVLLSADRTRSAEVRAAEWSWLGWLPHLRPAHGQDCGLLMAYDREQVAARTAELVRRLEAYGSAPGAGVRPGPAVLVVVDGDPGPAALRESLGRLARDGAGAGIHLLCLAETPPASPASPVAATVEAANAACPVFPECGALALLSGDVATAVRVLHRTPQAPGTQAPGTHAPGVPAPGMPAPGSPASEAASVGGTRSAGAAGYAGSAGCAGFTAPAGPVATGPVATVDAVSAAWAERFARALAPLREPEGAGPRAGAARPAVALPPSCRLLDELGLARATPAALLARWSERGGDTSGHAPLVFGAGPHGPLEADLADLSPLAGAAGVPLSGSQASSPLPGHALISGGPGTGKTELLRSLSASLAAGERPDRLALVLVDGAGTEAGDGLRACAELPHVTGHLAAGDPVRMREFAQALSAELKRRAELIGDQHTYEEYVRAAARPGGRVIAQRQSPDRSARAEQAERGERTERATAALPAEGEGADRRAELAPGQSARTGTARAEERTAQDGGTLDTLSPHPARRPAGEDPNPNETQAQAPPQAHAQTQPPAQPQTQTRAQATAPVSAPAREQGREQGPGQTQGQAPGSGAGQGQGLAPGQDQGPGPSQGQGQAPVESRAQGGVGAQGADASVEADTTRRTLRLRPREDGKRAGRTPEGESHATSRVFSVPGGAEAVLPRLAVLVDDFDTLVDPALGNPGRPAAGSVVRALDAVARLGARLGVHVIATTGRADRTAGTAVAQGAALRAELSTMEGGEEAPKGRGTLTVTLPQAPGAASHGAGAVNQGTGARGTGAESGHAGAVAARTPSSAPGGFAPSPATPSSPTSQAFPAATGLPFQAGRVTGRIPRTATLRPTVVPLDWTRAGDPPTRRHVRELGNGPTDLALLASAMERAAASLGQPAGAPARTPAASRSRSGQDDALDS
ncbi:FHA domain-containing protein [Streptomyces iconiensis]|uniref:FtsK/SpoIIIE domain-containing protein n=1 Tax=Streptomyces iconiensis TaxID=1384038 RepID=A0ABT7A8B9_9ACTN|nr:FHA domain-containing protein [Streptomyces iconiensis]MDJ1137587.1 FtsK/SpoIIIE domain-containing protein [Streptomyces iconiensis]